jgi:hypothetical protein
MSLHAVLGGTIGVALPEPQDDEERECDRADAGTVGAIFALWLSPHPHLSRPRWASHERRPGLPALSRGRPAAATQEATQARGSSTVAPAGQVTSIQAYLRRLGIQIRGLAHFWALRTNVDANLLCNARKLARTAIAAISNEPAKTKGAPGLPLRSRARPAAGVNSAIPT